MRDESALATFLAFAPGERDGEQRVVGLCSLYDYPALPSTAYIALLSAHPGYHGRGVGRDLLKVALERTVALGYNRLDLNTWAGNTKAVPLYKKSGYFWAPETSVRMENYLPLIFRLEPAREFFRHADWYRDYKRELGLEEDDQKIGKLQVYTYLWERDGRHLKVVIDRVSNGIAALETDEYSISTSIDEPRIPIGGTRTVTWSLENYRAGPLGVTLLAEGEDSVRCAFQTSGTVRQTQQWTTTISAEQSNVSAPPNRPSNRVRSTVVIDGQAVPLALSTKITQPVMLRFSVQRT